MEKTVKTISHDAVAALEEFLDTPLSRDSFCMMPFTHLSTTIHGEIKLCCRSKPISDIQSENIETVWQRLQEKRNQLISGVKIPECRACWTAEEKGITSLRNGQNIERSFKYRNSVREFVETGKIRHLPTLELKLSNRCNLKCRMCSPQASTPWLKDWKSVKEIYGDEGSWIEDIIEKNDLDKNPVLDLFLKSDSFVREFDEFSENIRELDFAGGEPLIDPLHYRVLEALVKKGVSSQVTLRYSTNLTTLGLDRYHVMDLWAQFKEIHLTISIDGYPLLNEFIRTGVKTSVFERNLWELQNSSLRFKFKGSTTVSAYNALFLGETCEYVERHLGIPWHTSRVTSPKFLDARILPEKIRERAVQKLIQFPLETILTNSSTLFKTRRHLADCIHWLQADLGPMEELKKKFIDYTAILDRKRKTDFNQFLKLENFCLNDFH